MATLTMLTHDILDRLAEKNKKGYKKSGGMATPPFTQEMLAKFRSSPEEMAERVKIFLPGITWGNNLPVDTHLDMRLVGEGCNKSKLDIRAFDIEGRAYYFTIFLKKPPEELSTICFDGVEYHNQFNVKRTAPGCIDPGTGFFIN